MTSRDFNLTYLDHPYLPKSGGNRREQLEAMFRPSNPTRQSLIIPGPRKRCREPIKSIDKGIEDD
jgi:hypothetical protein